MKEFQKLSRAEMKNVTGGVAAPPAGGGGGCYAHTANWSQSQWYPDAAQAQAGASAAAQSSGQHIYWCCASC